MKYQTTTVNRLNQIIEFNKWVWGTEEGLISHWLILGCPDDASVEEIRSYVEEEETYLEWLQIMTEIEEAWSKM